MMRLARSVPTLGLLLMLGLAGGCGPGTSAPLSKEQSEKIRESRKSAHQQLKAKVEQEGAQGAAGRKAAHRRAR